MKKALHKQLAKTILALSELSADLANAYLAHPEQTHLADAANQAAEMCEHLEHIWAYSQHKLSKLVSDPNYAPIKPLVLEVIAIKALAAKRRRDAKAQEQAAIFKLGNIATFREACHV